MSLKTSLRTLLSSGFLVSTLLSPTVLAKSLLIDIEGIADEALANVERSLSISQLLHEEDWLSALQLRRASPIDDSISESKIKRLHNLAINEIKLALQPFGYYQPDIKASLNYDNDLWEATYRIDPGDPVLIRELSITTVGTEKDYQENQELQELLADAQPVLNRGQRLKHQAYEAKKAALLDAALSRGYLDARFSTSTLLIDRAKKTADITLTLDAGQQYKFGRIDFSQQILSDDLIEEYLTFAKGDVFNTDKLVALQLALNDSNYFERVEVVANRESAEQGHIPVTVNVTPNNKRQYTYGIGYGTDTGLRTKLGIEFRRVNKRGHKVNTELLLSEVKQSFTTQYVVPFGKPGGDTLRYQGKYEQEDVGDGDAKRFSLGVNFNDTWRGWQRRFYLDYLNETFEFGSTRNTVNFLIPGISLSLAKADNLLLPHHGFSLFFDLHGGTETIISDTTFVQVQAVGQRVWSPSDRSRVLAKLEYGATSVDSFDALPTTERFFAGGDSSVRGYGYQSLAPADDEGNTIGGQYLLAASLEADYLIYNDFGGAIFVDVGDASNSNQFDLNRSVGIGLRWASPVGMFRLDIARPLDDEKSFRVHIGIGADL